jgi:hypothetical protein
VDGIKKIGTHLLIKRLGILKLAELNGKFLYIYRLCGIFYSHLGHGMGLKYILCGRLLYFPFVVCCTYQEKPGNPGSIYNSAEK